MTVYYLFRDTQDGSGCLDFYRSEQAAEAARLTEPYVLGSIINEQVQSLDIADPTGLPFDDEEQYQDVSGLVPVLFMLHALGDGTLSAEFFQSEHAWLDAWQAEGCGIVNEPDQVFYVADPTGIRFADQSPNISPNQKRARF